MPNPTVHRANTKIAIRKVSMINIKTAIPGTNLEAAAATTGMKTAIAPVIAPVTKPRAPGSAMTTGRSPRNDLDQRWRARYTQAYTYNDDVYYRDCRTTADPAGVIAGALIGGLVGNSVGSGGGRGGATVAGVIVGGALGAAMTRNLNCEDRSYAYKTYYDGFNSGRANSNYQWRNPNNGHYGNFRVVSYINDPDGFRCANYRQEIFIQGRPQTTTGRACQQPDGTWTIVS